MVTVPWYDSETLRKLLIDIFEDSKLSDCKVPVMIPAVILNTFQCRVFNTLPPKSKNSDHKLSVVDVIMASCAAPIFFSPVTVVGDERTYVDGGLWANSPALSVIIEMHKQNVEFRDMIMISIGNGHVPQGKVGSEFLEKGRFKLSMIKSLFDMMFCKRLIKHVLSLSSKI